MDEKPEEERKELWEYLVNRPSKYYRHTGYEGGKWEETTDIEGGFFTGSVISEYNMNLSFQFYRLFPDVYMSVDYGVTVAKVYLAARMIGAVAIYVESQVSAIVMYCGRHGIVEGLKYYAVLGDSCGPNGVFSLIEDTDNGESDSWKRNLKDTSELNSSDFGSLKDNGTVKVNQAGSDRPPKSDPNSFFRTENGEHVFVYDNNGDLIYDISSSRVKGFKINVNPTGKKFLSPYKLNGLVPQFILDLFGW